MAPRAVGKAILAAKFLTYLFAFLAKASTQALFTALSRPFTRSLSSASSLAGSKPADPSEVQNIVIIGASFAGYHAARIIASQLPPQSAYRVVVVEPHSHFHFTWALPRFCVVTGHEDKAFIPYGPLLKGVGGEEKVRWVQDRVSRVTRESVVLRGAGVEIPYAFLVVATGSGAADGLPSRVGSDDRKSGLQLMREFQQRIAAAQRIVVVGGGAAGVELAADAKEKYPGKNITLVHSRDALMHRFGPELQNAARKGLEGLGVELVLGERARKEEGSTVGTTAVVLKSGRTIECDLLIDCAGRSASSSILSPLTPQSISPTTGKILVKPTLQIADDSLPNVYVCGDVSETGVANPNAKFAYSQALVAGNNIALAAQGKKPSQVYKKFFADGTIKLTLGLTKSVTHLSDGNAELLFHARRGQEELMSIRVWSQLGVKPYVDEHPEGPAIKCSPAEVAALGHLSREWPEKATLEGDVEEK